MALRNHPACIGNDYDTLLSGEIVTSAACWISSSLPTIVVRVLIWIILTEPDREIAGCCVDATGLREVFSERWKPHSIGTDWLRINRLRLRCFGFRKRKTLLHLTVGGVCWPYGADDAFECHRKQHG